MRPDVKLGVVISMVVVLVAGGYYLYRDRSESAIPLATGPAPEADAEAAKGQAEAPVNAARERARPTVTRNLGPPSSRDGTVRRPPQVARRGPAVTRPHLGQSTTRTGNQRPAGGSRTTDVGSRVAKGGNDKSSPEQNTVADHRATPEQTQPVAQGSRGDAERAGAPPAETAVATADRTGQGQPPSTRPVTGRQARRPVPLVGKTSAGGQNAAKPGVVPTEAAVETHRVQQGDTMSSLAECYYGSAKFTRFLIESNPQIQDPNRLRVGMTVKIPAKPSEHTSPRATATGRPPGSENRDGRRTYRVQPGDTFYGIAQDQLGDSSRWEELFELNKEIVHGDPKRLQVGQVLVLPTS